MTAILATCESVEVDKGIVVTYETVREWCRKFGPQYARAFDVAKVCAIISGGPSIRTGKTSTYTFSGIAMRTRPDGSYPNC